MSRVLLEARRVGYRVDAATLVDEIDVEVRPGEVLGLVGPNGAGKTTLLRLLAGEIRPGSGEVLLEGRPIHAYRPAELALRRAVLPQHTVLQFAFRVLEVVMMGRHPHRDSGPEEDREAVGNAMARADVDGLSRRLFPTLSGGEQARVAFARVLAQETPVVLLDEPSASLDVRHQELVMAVLRSLAGEGSAVAAVLHDLNLAARHADRIGVMHRGRMVEIGATAEVLRSDLLSEVYGHPVEVVRHPRLDCPLVLPLRA